jgi:hypothetical protein
MKSFGWTIWGMCLALGCAGAADFCIDGTQDCLDQGETETSETTVSFAEQVVPAMDMRCSPVGCHGGPGQAGFSTDAATYDCATLHQEYLETQSMDAAPRVDPAVDPLEPDNTFVLLKGTNSVPHAGGNVLQGAEYDLMVQWVREGAASDCP